MSRHLQRCFMRSQYESLKKNLVLSFVEQLRIETDNTHTSTSNCINSHSCIWVSWRNAQSGSCWSNVEVCDVHCHWSRRFTSTVQYPRAFREPEQSTNRCPFTAVNAHVRNARGKRRMTTSVAMATTGARNCFHMCSQKAVAAMTVRRSRPNSRNRCGCTRRLVGLWQ